MNHRVLALGLACLTTFVSAGASAQGLRAPGAAKPGVARAPAASAKAPARTATAAAATAAAATAASAPATRQADYIVAVVNADPVTNNEVQARLARATEQLAAQGNPPPRELLLREVLERLILEKIQLQQATEGGIRVDDYAITQAELAVARQNSVSVAEMHQRLNADGITPAQFREDLRRQLTLQRLREREVEARVRVSEQDVDIYLRQAQSGTGDVAALELNLGHVLVAVPENADAATVAERQARAQAVAEQARAGQDFAALAREFSDAPERASGGLLGMRPAERYPELFVAATAALPVGAVAGPLRSGAGFHVLKVVEKDSISTAALVTQSHARHILLLPNAQLTEAAAAARLADYRRRILAGQADFATLAREHSKDGSAKQGGDLGWSTPGRYVPEFEAAMDVLQPGDISEPLVSRFGVHLVQLQERAEVELNAPEQRAMARDALREKKTEEAYENWMRELRARAYVEYRDAPQ